MKRTFTREEMFDFVDNALVIARGTWLWGHTETLVVTVQNDTGFDTEWRVTVQYHTQEGLQGDSFEGVLVRARKKMIEVTEWIEVE